MYKNIFLMIFYYALMSKNRNWRPTYPFFW